MSSRYTGSDPHLPDMNTSPPPSPDITSRPPSGLQGVWCIAKQVAKDTGMAGLWRCSHIWVARPWLIRGDFAARHVLELHPIGPVARDLGRDRVRGRARVRGGERKRQRGGSGLEKVVTKCNLINVRTRRTLGLGRALGLEKVVVFDSKRMLGLGLGSGRGCGQDEDQVMGTATATGTIHGYSQG